MTIWRHRLKALLLALPLLVASGASRAATSENTADLVPPAPLHEQLLSLPGDGAHPVQLQVTLYTPPGSGPFPLVIDNHGAPKAGVAPRDMPRQRYVFSAYYFLSRGYAVALPMMRGFAGSGGSMVNHACDLAGFGYDNARDIEAVIAALGRRPEIDARHVIVVGNSFGGWNTLALGAIDPRIAALASFQGGMKASTCPGAKGEKSLVTAAGKFGARTRTPSLWFYGENDSLFPHPIWSAMFGAYNAAGGHASLVDVGRFRDDSHQLLSYPEGLALWTGPMDSFLDRLHLPSAEIFPEYLPIPAPPPSNYAAIGDLDALPSQEPKLRTAYQDFLTRKTPRAFVVAVGGQSVSSYGGFDPLGRALGICLAYHAACLPYAVDDAVVWRGDKIAAPAHPALGDVAALPAQKPGTVLGYEQFLSLASPRAFVVAPDGGWAEASGKDAARQALAYCAARNPDCALYATGDTVVWHGRP